jgi:hypothetical protein
MIRDRFDKRPDGRAGDMAQDDLEDSPQTLSRSWEMRVLFAVIATSFALGGWALLNVVGVV